ncbi:MAG: hypothetical protein N3F63_07055, partial [Thermoplasmata archaeon]|nr:hypothetical protein [Thermoplasmata archaeon]
TFICANVSEATIRDDISMYVSDESWTEKLKKTSLGRALIFNKDARPSGKLCLTFSTPQTVDLLAPAEIVELASKRKT